MRRDVSAAVGEALFPVLSWFQEIGQQPLRAVWEVRADGCLDRIILDFELLSLVVSAEPDYDTVDFETVATLTADRSGGIEMSGLPPWNAFVGVPFGRGWVTVNQQGYCDGLLLSFGVIKPQIVLNVCASSIDIGIVG